jgi:hypothetical protein
MPRFIVYAKTSLTLWAEIEATDEQDARAKAALLGLPEKADDDFAVDGATWHVDTSLDGEAEVTDAILDTQRP